jgi:hypothetical protein
MVALFDLVIANVSDVALNIITILLILIEVYALFLCYRFIRNALIDRQIVEEYEEMEAEAIEEYEAREAELERYSNWSEGDGDLSDDDEMVP